MRVQQKGLAVFDDAVGVLEIGFAFADGLDLRSAQGNACLELIEQKAVMTSGAVDGGVAGTGWHLGSGLCRGLRFLWGSRGHLMAGLAGHWSVSLRFMRGYLGP